MILSLHGSIPITQAHRGVYAYPMSRCKGLVASSGGKGALNRGILFGPGQVENADPGLAQPGLQVTGNGLEPERRLRRATLPRPAPWVRSRRPVLRNELRSPLLGSGGRLSGAGARAYRGRLAPIGTRAVYLSATDAGASKEVTARESRLGGIGQISVEKYPRGGVRGRRRFEEIAQPFRSWIVAGCRGDQGCLSG